MNDERWDLGHWLHPDVPHMSTQPGFTSSRLREVPQDLATVTEFAMASHTGTHVDVAFHAIESGRRLHDYPLAFWEGTLQVVAVQATPGGPINAEELERVAPPWAPDSMLAIATGWDRHWESELYHDHPYLTADAADWVVARRPRVLLIDTLTPEPPEHRRSLDYAFGVHRRILGADIPIVENARRLVELVDRSVRVIIAPLPLLDGDGAPCRVLAWTDARA